MRLTRLVSDGKIYSINVDRILFIEQDKDQILIEFGGETLIFKDAEAEEVAKQLFPKKAAPQE